MKLELTDELIAGLTESERAAVTRALALQAELLRKGPATDPTPKYEPVRVTDIRGGDVEAKDRFGPSRDGLVSSVLDDPELQRS